MADGVELHWPGKRLPDLDAPRPALAPLEMYGDGSGRLLRADNLRLPCELDGAFDLVYLDPPFHLGANPAAAPDLGGFHAYADTWSDLEAYLQFMYARLALTRRLLKDSGSLFLHADYHAAHLLAALLDELFGRGDRGPRKHAPGFRNEIVWSYGLGGSSARCFPKKHDVILWYTKGEDWHFDPPRVPATSQRLSGQLKKQPDTWDDIPSLNNQAAERSGYPTQKPLTLLERLITAASRPGELVGDFFCGSGTTLVAAHGLGRRWLGCDAGAFAVHTARKRLLAAGAGFTLSGEPAPTATDKVELRRHEASGGRFQLELADGIGAVDWWAVGPPSDVFRPRWQAGRGRREACVARYSPPLGGPIEVHWADRSGAEGVIAAPGS
jgi:DNA modification methylase